MKPAEILVQLRRLEYVGRLGKLLDQDVDHLPWGDVAYVMQVPAFLGVGIHLYRMARGASETREGPEQGDLLWLLLLCVVAMTLRLGWRLLRTPTERRHLRVRRRGQLVPATMVQVNDRYFSEGNTASWPGAVLLSFDPLALERPELLSSAAQRLFQLKSVDRRTVPSAHAEIAWSLYHEMWPLASIPVPEDLTSGLRDCVLADAQVPAAPLMQNGHMWALAKPGDLSHHAVAVIPETVLTRERRVSWLRAFVWRWFVRA